LARAEVHAIGRPPLRVAPEIEDEIGPRGKIDDAVALLEETTLVARFVLLSAKVARIGWG
jgi:hypothetical protein